MQTHTRSQKGHHPFVSRYSVSTGTRTRKGDADADDDSSCSLEEENWTSRLSQEETSVTDSSDVALLAATEGRSVRVPHPNPNLPMRVRVRVTDPDPDPDPDDELELEARRTDWAWNPNPLLFVDNSDDVTAMIPTLNFIGMYVCVFVCIWIELNEVCCTYVQLTQTA